MFLLPKSSKYNKEALFGEYNTTFTLFTVDMDGNLRMYTDVDIGKHGRSYHKSTFLYIMIE